MRKPIPILWPLFLFSLMGFPILADDFPLNNPIKVAVIDSGIDLEHPRLKPHIFYNEDFPHGYDFNEDHFTPQDSFHQIKPNFVPLNPGTNRLQNIGNFLLRNGLEVLKTMIPVGAPGHGTHVSGLVLEECENTCELIPLRVFGKNEFKIQHIIDAIELADTLGAKIINMSLGVFEERVPENQKPKFWELENIIKGKSHILFVVASGNDGINLEERKNKILPAMIEAPHVIVVGSKNETGERSQFSNFGDKYLDLYERGENQMSTWPGGLERELSGTSMASPRVAGKLAKFLFDNPSLALEEISQMLSIVTIGN